MSSNPKIPVERRRRSGLLHDVMRFTRASAPTPLRRESDQVRARMQRWIELADRALGRPPTPNQQVDAPISDTTQASDQQDF
ncbi:MAG TPA: hypothetical protein VJO35_17520 [Terriglobales bacterium]|nr:hypothetical protein [Terriglobales bacterium]